MGIFICGLKKCGFEDSLISWIKLLYLRPTATVITKRQPSEQFSLGRGTRQGCSLSPLLFAIAIEPLAIALRQSEDFQGKERWGRTHKRSLCADDLLLYVSDPLSSVPSILNILAQFGNFSDYKINFKKSVSS